VERLTITAEERNGEFSVICGLRAAQLGRPLALSEWAYGQSVAGFVSIGSCAPLLPGTYRIDVEGGGAGSRTIAIAADGGLDQKTPRCSP
jgi:hypothetical protein